MQIQNALLTGSTTVYGPITFVSGSIIGSSSYAATSSYADTFTVAGSLTAQTLVVQTITSSISFITGSTRFGSLQTNTHTFTGSLQVTGSGPHTVFGNVQMGNIASVATATPVILSLGGTFSSTAGSNVKLRVYEEASSIGGMSVSAGQMEVNTWSSGKIAFYRGTTQTAIIDGSGNLGIGTATPAKKLDVLGDIRLRTDATGLGPSLILNNGTEAANNYSQIAFGGTNNSINYLKGGIAYATVASGYGKGHMYFLQNSIDDGSNATLANAVMAITNTGSVGIGLINPSSKLHVSGSGSGSLFQISSTVSSSIFFVSGSGNIGVGTTTPQRLLHLSGSGDTYIRVDRGSIQSLFGTDDIGTYIGQQGANDLRLITNAAERFRITSAGTASFTGNSLATAADAATINLKQNSTTANTGIYLERSGEQKGYYIYMGGSVDSLTFQRNNAGTKGDVMSLTRDGNVGIGTTNPTYQLQVSSASGGLISLNSTVTNTFRGIVFQNNAASDSTEYAYIKYNATSGEMRYYANPAAFGGYTTFYSNNTESMRITSGGNVLIGTTSAGTDFTRMSCATTGANVLGLVSTDDSSGAGFLICRNSATTLIGDISRVGTTNAVAFNTTSDYRLKEDLKEIKGLEKLSHIKVYDFKWKDNDARMDGVIAHELQEVLPYAVHGEKDGKEMQGVDYSKLVPILVKAIQELKAENDTLKDTLQRNNII